MTNPTQAAQNRTEGTTLTTEEANPSNSLLTNLANLIKVKTLITLFMTLVFSYLAITGTVSDENFMSVFTMVVAFYFGTQHSK